MTRGRALRVGVAAVLAAGAHLALLHAVRAPEPAVQIKGGAVSFEIGAVAAPQGGAPANAAEALADAATNNASAPEPMPDPAPEPAPKPEPVPEPLAPQPAPAPEPQPREPLPEPAPTEPAPEPDPAPLETAQDPVRDASPSGDGADSDIAEEEERDLADARSEDEAAENSVAGAEAGGAQQERNASEAGNAASASYAGEVMRHLSRVRRPRASGPGSAFVSFTVAPSGELENIAILESSGSSRFDRDALRVVERAAPFPQPPSGVNRSFVVEIEGR